MATPMVENTSNVIELDNRRTDPHLIGEARCMACGHTEMTVAPVGVTLPMECGNCHTMKKVFIEVVLRNTEHWTCACGNNLFYITKDGTYCPNCGAWQTFP